MQDPQHELQKLHMLRAMGLQLYLPRYRLPGAAPSRVVPWGVQPALPRAQTALRQPAPADAAVLPHNTDPAVQPPSHQLRAALRETPLETATAAPPVAPSAPSATPASAMANADPDSAARFQALLLPVSASLAVLALVPTVARLQLPERERRLLQAILHWLGVAGAPLQAARPFQWPLPGMAQGNAAQAGESLRAFLDQARRELSFSRLLIFGEPLGEALDSAAHAPDMVTTYSLQQLTVVPALKRECWQALLPLWQALADERQ